MEQNEETAAGNFGKPTEPGEVVVRLSGDELASTFCAVVDKLTETGVMLAKTQKEAREQMKWRMEAWEKNGDLERRIQEMNQEGREREAQREAESTRPADCCPQCAGTLWDSPMHATNEHSCHGCGCVYDPAQENALDSGPLVIKEGTRVWIEADRLAKLEEGVKVLDKLEHSPCPCCGNPHEEGGGPGGLYCYTCHAGRENDQEVLDKTLKLLEQAEHARDVFKVEGAELQNLAGELRQQLEQSEESRKYLINHAQEYREESAILVGALSEIVHYSEHREGEEFTAIKSTARIALRNAEKVAAAKEGEAPSPVPDSARLDKLRYHAKLFRCLLIVSDSQGVGFSDDSAGRRTTIVLKTEHKTLRSAIDALPEPITPTEEGTQDAT